MSLNNDLTLIIKTFQRPECLNRLIQSIRLYYPVIKIIVVDDSKIPYISNDQNTIVYTLPFASGTSKGRNYAVSKVQTKYFMTLDDDFIFTAQTNLLMRYGVLENTDIDIIGNDVDDSQKREGMLLKIIDGKLYRWVGSKGESFGYKLHDYLAQCFCARTQKFKEAGGWDDEFLVWDHLVLFIRLLGKLKIAMLPIVDILHKPATSAMYNTYRWGERIDHDRKLLNKKYGLIEIEPLKRPPGVI